MVKQKHVKIFVFMITLFIFLSSYCKRHKSKIFTPQVSPGYQDYHVSNETSFGFISQNASHPTLPTSFKAHYELPHCMIIGEKKCGTSTLHEMLGTMYLNIKTYFRETNYFNGNRRFGFDEEGLNWYKHKFPQMESPEDIIVDKSPSYF